MCILHIIHHCFYRHNYYRYRYRYRFSLCVDFVSNKEKYIHVKQSGLARHSNLAQLGSS